MKQLKENISLTLEIQNELSMQHIQSISKENICTTLSYFSKFRQNQKFTHPFMYKIGFVLSHFFFYPKKTTYYHSDIFMHHQKWRCIFLLFEVLQIIWEIGKMEDLFYLHIFLCPHFENDPPLSSYISFNFLHPAFYASSN